MNITISENLKLWGEEIIYSILILIGFWLLARFVRYFLGTWVLRFTKHTETELDDRIIEAIKGPVYYILLLSGLYLAIYNLPLPHKLKTITDGIIYVMGVGIGVFMVNRVIDVLLEWYTHNVALKTDSQIEREFLPIIEKLVFIFVFITGLIIVLKHFNYDVLSLVTALGVTSLAIGLAAKDTLANMISGFTLMLDRPFRVGDRVQLASGELGDVMEIGLRSTRIKTLDNNILVVPNTELVNTKVINQCYPDITMKGRVKVGISYTSDVEKAKGIMLEIAKGHPKVVQEPPPMALFTGFGESALDMEMFFWVEDYKELGLVTDQINMEIKRRFEGEGIEIPYPIRTVYVKGGGKD
ncbi:MAG: mechanosensitive ion channel [Deltaproteobacteria bacterium]|nr:mechanosensitive ion channel [Deltaproteobacteria bacterium]